MYISPIPFDELGFPSLDAKPVTVNLKLAVAAVPPVLVTVGAAMAGIYSFVKHRKNTDRIEQGDTDTDETA
jgi:hypothetical protein